MMKRVGDHVVLLACNRSTSEIEVTFKSSAFNPGDADVLHETRKVPAKGGAIHDAFDGLAVHAYAIK